MAAPLPATDALPASLTPVFRAIFAEFVPLLEGINQQVRAALPKLPPGQALRRGLAVIPRDPSLWERLVRLGLEHGDTERAVQDACEAIGHCPQGGDGSWHNLVGVFLLRQGAADQGRQIIELGLQGFPGHPGLTRLRELC